jgi:hypothetical protein
LHVTLLIACASCAAPAISLKSAPDLRIAQNARILRAVVSLGRDGDWLVIRGYKPTDDLVAALVNAPISHVGILDFERRQVIEADATGVHATALEDFVDHSHRLLLVRPIWSDLGRERALERARGLVGRSYDFLGLVGVDVPHRYYCSELAVRVYAEFQRKYHEIPRVIEPAHLYLWGTILYDSRPRHWED